LVLSRVNYLLPLDGGGRERVKNIPDTLLSIHGERVWVRGSLDPEA
jgi:hypothetical protein